MCTVKSGALIHSQVDTHILRDLASTYEISMVWNEVPAEENEDKLSLDTSTKSGEESAVENKVENMRVYSEEVERIGADDPTGGDPVWTLCFDFMCTLRLPSVVASWLQ